MSWHDSTSTYVCIRNSPVKVETPVHTGTYWIHHTTYTYCRNYSLFCFHVVTTSYQDIQYIMMTFDDHSFHCISDSGPWKCLPMVGLTTHDSNTVISSITWVSFAIIFVPQLEDKFVYCLKPWDTKRFIVLYIYAFMQAKHSLTKYGYSGNLQCILCKSRLPPNQTC